MLKNNMICLLLLLLISNCYAGNFFGDIAKNIKKEVNKATEKKKEKKDVSTTPVATKEAQTPVEDSKPLSEIKPVVAAPTPIQPDCVAEESSLKGFSITCK